MALPKYATAYSFNIEFISTSTGQVLTSPTLAAGDILVSTDDGNYNNIAVLPVVSGDSTKTYVVNLSISEMTGSKVSIELHDVAGNQWTDQFYSFDIPTQNIDDVPINAGLLDVNVEQIDNSAEAATKLKTSSRSIVSGIVVSGSNSASVFKTNLTGTTNLYGNSEGGSVLVVVDTPNPGRRITAFNASTQYITVTPAFDSILPDGTEFVILGRIEA